MQKRILITASTPMELFLLSSVCKLLATKDHSLSFDLVIRSTMRHILTPQIEGLFSKVYYFRFPREKSLLEGIIVGIYFSVMIKKIINNYDVILINSFRELSANIISKHVKDKSKLIAICSTDPTTSEDFQIRRPHLSYKTYILSKLLGYSVMNMRWCGDSPLVFSKDYEVSPFRKALYISEKDETTNSELVAVPPPFFVLTDMHSQTRTFKQPAILIAGERIPLYPSWSAKDEQIYQSFLSYVKENFPDHHIYFKPRPGLTNVDSMKLEGMKLVEDNRSLELILMSEKFDKVISMKSTASVLASFYGHQGYHLYHMFNCPKDFLDATDHLYANLKSVIMINNNEDINRVSLAKKDAESIGSIYYNAIFGSKSSK